MTAARTVMKTVVFLVSLAAVGGASAQEFLSGSLYYSDGSAGRVSYIDMVLKGKPGMTMKRADGVQITITQHDIDYALNEVSIDGSVYRDEEGNVIIVISATHRRVIAPDGATTEIFEDPAEFKKFFLAFAARYPKVVKAVDKKGKEYPYLAVKNDKNMSGRAYMRVKPYEQICVIESVNYPVLGSAYREMRATARFAEENPGAVYLADTTNRGNLILYGDPPEIRPAGDGYFSFVQEAGTASVNNEINVSREMVKYLETKQDISEITAQEMENLFDGSLLNAEVITGKGDGISSAVFDSMRGK
jgi:hypothetical protein